MGINSLHDARKAVSRPDSQLVSDRLAMLDGDLWLNGRGWSGPRVEEGASDYSSVMSEIRRAFVSANKVAEIVERHQSAVIGKEARITLEPRRPVSDETPITEAEQVLIDEATALVLAWFDDREALRAIQEAVRLALTAGPSCLRVYVPAGLMVDGAVEAASPDAAAGLIYIDALNPLSAAVVTDPNTKQQSSVYLYQDADTRRQRAEVCAVTPDGQTVIRVLDHRGEIERAEVEIGGRLPVVSLRTPHLVTAQVVELQRLVSLAYTMMQKNVVIGGFLERVIMGAQLPGAFVDQPDGSRRFVPEPFTVGPGTTNVLQGQPIYDDEGNIRGFTNPSISYRDPVGVATFSDTIREAYRAILEETDQLHALITGDATASGESRRQALADFASSLLPTKTAVESAGRWLVETLLAFAGYFSGQPGRYDALRCNFVARLDLGPLPVAEINAVSELVVAQLLSRESGMVRVGVDDPTAEKQLIADEQDADADRRARMFNAGGPLDMGSET